MKPRVLVIDGYEGFRRAMEYCLTQAGFAVASAESARAALPLVRAHAVDVVLLDATQSFEDGLKECRVLKDWAEFASAAVVLLGDRATSGQREAARRAGAEAVMPKLFEWQELVARVERLARERSQEKDERRT